MEHVVEVESLRVIYRRAVSRAGIRGLFRRRVEEVHALRGVSFQLREGEILGYIGPNGAGKTTTLKVLAGTLRPDGGEVRVLGFVPWSREREFLRQISFVMSGRGFLEEVTWDLPVMDGFLLVKDLYRLGAWEFQRSLAELVPLFELEGLLEIPLRQLSHGQRARVELCAALLWRPKVLLLDEPTLGLDLMSQVALRRFIREYVKRTNAACIVTSHYTRDIEDLADRVLLLNQGEIIAHGTPAELARKLCGLRRLRVLFVEEVPREKLSAIGELVELEGPQAVLDVPAEQAKDAVRMLLEEFPVADLALEEPNLEEVLRAYFSGEAG